MICDNSSIIIEFCLLFELTYNIELTTMRSFYKALFKNPRAIGSITPSSPWLARGVASMVPLSEGYILEIGAGTGAITKALLWRGIPHHQLIVVERSEILVDELKSKFPLIKIFQGDAKDLSTLLGDLSKNINTIVSSLPLLILPEETKNKIISEIEKLLNPRSYYIQYTHGLVSSVFESKVRFKKIKSKNIWLNFPPARIDVFKIEEN